MGTTWESGAIQSKRRKLIYRGHSIGMGRFGDAVSATGRSDDAVSAMAQFGDAVLATALSPMPFRRWDDVDSTFRFQWNGIECSAHELPFFSGPSGTPSDKFMIISDYLRSKKDRRKSKKNW